MNKAQLQKMVSSDGEQVFLFHCLASIPATPASHPWFVINHRGHFSRWEVRHFHGPSGDHLHHNAHPPFLGIEIVVSVPRFYWPAHLVQTWEGPEAERLIQVLETSPQLYPFAERYSLRGPNSNTYARWVLDRAGLKEVELPPRSVGENFDYRQG